MDQTVAACAGWCQRAEGRPAVDGDDDPLDLLREARRGVRLRRRLDADPQAGAGPDDPTRARLVAAVERLEGRALDRIGRSAADSQLRREVATWAEKQLLEEKAYLAGLLGRGDLGPVRRGILLEAMRPDLLAWERLAARLDGDPMPHPAVAAEVELARLREAAGRPVGPAGAAPRALLDEVGARMHRALLIRRVREEVAHPIDHLSPQDLWAHRLMLARLQAELEAADTGLAAAPPGPEADGDDARAWADRLDSHRAALTLCADGLLAALPPSGRRAAWEEILTSAQGEANEIVTILEVLPPAQAVRLLELARRDLEDLAASGRRQADQADAGAPEAERVGPLVRQIERMARVARNELQEKRLDHRLRRRFGSRAITWLENLVLVLILAMAGLIAAEAFLESRRELSAGEARFFARADLAISAVFLFEFLLKWGHAEGRWLYFRRHLVVDFLPSIPFGFLSHALTSGATGRVFEALEFGRLVRFLRIARPAIRVARLVIFALRFLDRLVRRSAPILNRGIVLFQPQAADDFESRVRHLLIALRRRHEDRTAEAIGRLEDAERLEVIGWALADLGDRLGRLPSAAITAAGVETVGREVPVEAVVERLVRMTPDRLVEQMGPGFVSSIDRYVRLLDVPIVRNLPLARDLVAHRERGAAEGAALAVNQFGHAIQRSLDVAYYLADLQGTVSPPLFLDRLGTVIVNATRRPARRLIMLGLAFLTLYLVVESLTVLRPIRGLVDKIQTLLGLPVIVLGVICLVLWVLGEWFRRIANQASDFSERVVEAQFAAQTKALKAREGSADARFLAERVIAPEITLRGSDGQAARVEEIVRELEADGRRPAPVDLIRLDPEMAFLRSVNLLYEDYLDGSPFHRSDTKATTQLLGNLALGNLRRSHLELNLSEGKRLERLDLTRAAGVFGGPYLWFQYITRMVAQDTAQLLVDYNRHAVPLDRLACSPRPVRAEYRRWLAGRLGLPEEAVDLPEPVGKFGDAEPPADAARRAEAGDFFETVEFTALDFLAGNPERDAEIRARFGPQVAELLVSDRRRNVRRAFRSFPLHRLPESQRTVNPFLAYQRYVAGGRVLLLPFRAAGWAVQGLAFAARGIVRVVRAILRPEVAAPDDEPDLESFQAALRKIHRMRKPAFMTSLWLRARCDAEYLGLPLPGVPHSGPGESLLEQDLDFIGATRRDRLRADRIRAELGDRVARAGRWLGRFGWDFPSVPETLRRDFPHLADRSGEVVRALVSAVVVDFHDVDSLGLSIEGLARVIDHAADPEADPRALPHPLPDPLPPGRPFWHRPMGRVKSVDALLDLPCFPALDDKQRRRVRRYLRRHRRVVGGWMRVLRIQGGPDPWETLRGRLREVLLRTDLWSEQILILRTIQTLTLLDVHHYSELVRGLGGYDRGEREGVTGALPFAVVGLEDEALAPAS